MLSLTELCLRCQLGPCRHMQEPVCSQVDTENLKVLKQSTLIPVAASNKLTKLMFLVLDIISGLCLHLPHAACKSRYAWKARCAENSGVLPKLPPESGQWTVTRTSSRHCAVRLFVQQYNVGTSQGPCWAICDQASSTALATATR